MIHTLRPFRGILVWLNEVGEKFMKLEFSVIIIAEDRARARAEDREENRARWKRETNLLRAGLYLRPLIC